MKKYGIVFIVLSFLLFAVSCDNSTNQKGDVEPVNDDEATDAAVDETADETVDEAVDIDEETTDEFNPDDPGYSVEFFFADMNTMGSPMAMIAGYIMKTAREDLEETYEGPTYMLDTCVIGEEAPGEPECTSKEDCAPEQECVPDTDRDGKPVPNSEHCETPGRESLDVGPIKIKGFESGEQTFLYEPNDQVYKLNGEGDGSVDPALITYDVDYTLTAEDPTPEDLNPFTATFHMQKKFDLTSHTIVPSDQGFPYIEVDMTQPLSFSWTENDPVNGYVELTVTAMKDMNNTVSVSCTVIDDGEFTIPAEFASNLQFGTGMLAQMGSMLSMTRKVKSPMTGDTISAGSISSEQIFLVNVRPAQ